MVNIKNNKVIATLLVVLLTIICSLTCIVKAESKYTITIYGAGQGHSYSAYQVFDGLLDAEKTGILSNIKWGKGVNAENLLIQLKASNVEVNERILNSEGTDSVPSGSTKTIGEIFKNCTYARDVAQVLELYENDSDMTKAFAEIVNSNLGTVSATSSYEGNEYKIEVENAGYYFIKDSDDLTGTNEAYTRYILHVARDQKIKVKGSVPTLEKTESLDGNVTFKALSAEIGDVIKYRLEGTLPTTYDDYTTYKYKFTDTLSTGLKYVDGSLKVYIVDKDGTEHENNSFEVKINGQNIEVSIENLKDITEVTKDSKIVVKYDAKLTEDAVVGGVGNENKAHLEFSNNPNAGGSESTEDTPEEKVKVYTYELDINKENGKTKQALQNVGFKLYKKEGDKTLYAKVNTDTNALEEWVEQIDDATELFTDSNGHIAVKGLKAGEYYLKETTVLDGYNSIEDIKLKIEEVLIGNEENEFTQSLDSLSLKVTVTDNGNSNETTINGDVSNGSVEATILNYPGTLLPGTGGIGTIIFYVIGGLLIVGSALFLIRTKSLNK